MACYDVGRTLGCQVAHERLLIIPFFFYPLLSVSVFFFEKKKWVGGRRHYFVKRGGSALGDRRSDTPMVVPSRSWLETIKRMMKGNIGRGSKQQNLMRSRYCSDCTEVHRKTRCGSLYSRRCVDFLWAEARMSPQRLVTAVTGACWCRNFDDSFHTLSTGSPSLRYRPVLAF